MNTMRNPDPKDIPAIVVAYDGRNGDREFKKFMDVFQAKRFYAAKFKSGKNPTIKKNLEKPV